MPKHIVRLIFLIGILGAAILGVRAIFIDKSFGIYGHYRADAVAEIAADAPIYQGAASCQSCHLKQYAMWFKGAHKVVTCENCHGVGAKHPSAQTAAPAASADPRMHIRIAAGRLDHVKLVIPTDTVKLCTVCHEKITGRPAAQRQIEVSTHSGTQECTTCHNPYSPKIAIAAIPIAVKTGDIAAGREIAARCAGCHGVAGVSSNPAWPSLAGQQPVYLLSALNAYKTGARRDPLMTVQAAGLSAAETNNLVAYFSRLNCQSAGPARPASEASAAKEKAVVCATCHGAAGISRNPAWPNLAGQQKDYLVSALKAYQAGTRKDPMMTKLVKNLSAADIKQLAARYVDASCKQ